MFIHKKYLTDKSFWYFAQSLAIGLPCSVQNTRRVSEQKVKLWINEISISDYFTLLLSLLLQPLGVLADFTIQLNKTP